MGRFVRRDLFQVRVERVREAGCDELGLSKVRKTTTVEVVFEMLQDQGIGENRDVTGADGCVVFTFCILALR